MIGPIFSRVVLGFCLLGGALAAGGCSSDAAAERSPEASGALSMPLLSSVGGRTYRLTGYIQVVGTSSWYYDYLYLGADTDVVSIDLQTGDYNAYLYSWELSRDDGTGTFRPVSATLASNYYQSFSIFNGATTTVSYDFQTDGEIVTVGSGKLNVDVRINETPGVCSPLGSGCPDGTWCAPSELLGADVQCIAAGAVEVGAPCRSPTDCVANSTCIDFGQGAQCTQLCLSADFGQPCPSGGTCTPQGADYGACSPESGDGTGAPGAGGASGG